MRLSLANTLRTRTGNHTKDARNINSYPDSSDDVAMVRKRPGCEPTGFDFTTPLQGFSSLADMVTPVPYGEFGDINNLLISISGDTFTITDISPTSEGVPTGVLSYYSQAFAAYPPYITPDWYGRAQFFCSDGVVFQFTMDSTFGRRLFSSNDGGRSWATVNAMDETVGGDMDGDPFANLLPSVTAMGLHRDALFVVGNFPKTLKSINGGVSFYEVGAVMYEPTNSFPSIVSDGDSMYGWQRRGNGFNLYKSVDGSSWALAALQYADSNATVGFPVFHAGMIWFPFFEHGTGETRIATYSTLAGIENHDLNGAANGETLHLVSDGVNLYAYENFTTTGIKIYLVNVADFSLTEIYSNASFGYPVFDFSFTNAFFDGSRVLIPVKRGDYAVSLYDLTMTEV